MIKFKLLDHPNIAENLKHQINKSIGYSTLKILDHRYFTIHIF